MKDQKKKEEILDSLPFRSIIEQGEHTMKGELLWNAKNVFQAMELFAEYKTKEEKKNNNTLGILLIAFVIAGMVTMFWVGSMKQTIRTLNTENFNLVSDTMRFHVRDSLFQAQNDSLKHKIEWREIFNKVDKNTFKKSQIFIEDDQSKRVHLK